MDIKLDAANNQIKIDDNLKFQYWMLKFIMLSNLFQMFVGLIKGLFLNGTRLPGFGSPLVSCRFLYCIISLNLALKK